MKYTSFLCFLILLPLPTFAQDDMIGRWRYQCPDDVCRAFLSLMQDDRRILTWQIVGDRKTGEASMVVTSPLGSALLPGLRILAGQHNFQVPFQVCDEQGCAAVAVVTDEMRAAISSVDTVQVATVPYGGSTFAGIEVPVSGFADAVDRVTAEVE